MAPVDSSTKNQWLTRSVTSGSYSTSVLSVQQFDPLRKNSDRYACVMSVRQRRQNTGWPLACKLAGLSPPAAREGEREGFQPASRLGLGFRGRVRGPPYRSTVSYHSCELMFGRFRPAWGCSACSPCSLGHAWAGPWLPVVRLTFYCMYVGHGMLRSRLIFAGKTVLHVVLELECLKEVLEGTQFNGKGREGKGREGKGREGKGRPEGLGLGLGLG